MCGTISFNSFSNEYKMNVAANKCIVFNLFIGSGSGSFIVQPFVGVILLIVFCVSCSSIICLYYKKRKGK